MCLKAIKSYEELDNMYNNLKGLLDIKNGKVDASKKIRKVENFWNNIHFHPTDAIEDMWGQFVLDNVAKDNVAKYNI